MVGNGLHLHNLPWGRRQETLYTRWLCYDRMCRRPLSHNGSNAWAVFPAMRVNKIRLREAFCLRREACTSFQILCSLSKEPGVLLIRSGASGKEEWALPLKRARIFWQTLGSTLTGVPSLTWGSPLWSKQRNLNRGGGRQQEIGKIIFFYNFQSKRVSLKIHELGIS